MRPTLAQDDWLLVDPVAFADAPPEAGDLVLLPDPRDPSRLLVKRVAEVHDGAAELFVIGDAPKDSTDSRAFGSIETGLVEGPPWFRYWPPRRRGRVR
jgi:hypothetical protein